jgi:hypothetical protein
MSLKVLAQVSAICSLALLASYSVQAQAQGDQQPVQSKAAAQDKTVTAAERMAQLNNKRRLLAQAQAGQGAATDPMAIYRQAGVSQEQETRIRQLAKDFEDQARVKAKRMMGLIQEMHQLSLETDPDEKAVLAKQDEINGVTGEMASDRIKLLLTIRKQLTPEQKAKLVGMMKGGGEAPAAAQ